jgi:Skp family chaperone for outer membrane proteins
MILKYVDFEKVTSHFVEYRNGVDKINDKKKEFLLEIEPIRKEMNSIISSVSSGLIIDTMSQKQKTERFQQLQNELMQKDSQFKSVLKEMQDELNVKSFDSLSELISVWAEENNIDVVSSKIETIFVRSNFDATNDIIDILKSKDLFIELPEVKKEEN